jgi:serine/threonine protein kinase
MSEPTKPINVESRAALGLAMTTPAGTGNRLLLQAGTRLGAYELIRELGRGGMGQVWLARDTKLARRVAIKFLGDDLARGDRAVRRRGTHDRGGQPDSATAIPTTSQRIRSIIQWSAWRRPRARRSCGP